MTNRERFDRFTQQAREVLRLAQEEAQRFQHNYVGTEHLLLGLVRVGDSVVDLVLRRAGVELKRIGAAVEASLEQREHPPAQQVPLRGLTEEAKKTIERAVDEARRLNHYYIGTEHLLLGLARTTDGEVAQVLQSYHITLSQLRTLVIQVLHEAIHRNDEKAGSTGPFSAPPQPVGEARHTLLSQAASSGLERIDRFTDQAKRVLRLAEEEARRFQHNYVGTEHLLLGLVKESEGVAGQVLQKLDVSLEKVRKAVEFIIGYGDRVVEGQVGLTPRAKKVIELAVDEARLLNHHYLGTEHLLLGLIHEGEGIAAGILESVGVRLARARQETMNVLEQRGTARGKGSSITETEQDPPEAQSVEEKPDDNQDGNGGEQHDSPETQV